MDVAMPWNSGSFFFLSLSSRRQCEKKNIVDGMRASWREKEREFFLSMVMGERRERERRRERESVSCLLTLCMLVDFFLFHA
jgi:hypothetical protein